MFCQAIMVWEKGGGLGAFMEDVHTFSVIFDSRTSLHTDPHLADLPFPFLRKQTLNMIRNFSANIRIHTSISTTPSPIQAPRM